MALVLTFQVQVGLSVARRLPEVERVRAGASTPVPRVDKLSQTVQNTERTFGWEAECRSPKTAGHRPRRC